MKRDATVICAKEERKKEKTKNENRKYLWCIMSGHESVQSPEMENNQRSDIDLVELILKDIGGTFRRFQILNYILFCLPFALSGSFGLSYVFTALNLDYRCFIPECETFEMTTFEPVWLHNAVPYQKGKPSNCQRYSFHSFPLNNGSYWTSECKKDDFNSSNHYRCDKFKYRTDEISVLNEYGLECEENAWPLAMTGTANNIGRFIFMPIMSYLSDRYGRRTILIVGVFSSALFAYIQSYATNYVTFLVFELLNSGIGSVNYSASFILAMEWIGCKDRVLLGAIVTATYPFGQLFLGFTARAVRNFRYLLRIIYGPGFLILLYFWIAPESIRWLIVHKKKSHLIRTVQKAEQMNGMKLSEQTWYTIGMQLQQKQSNSTERNDPSISSFQGFKQLLKKRIFLVRFLIGAFVWLTSAFVSYGISLTSVTLAGDKYVNFMVIAMAGVPAMLVCYFLMESCGRRWTLFVSFLSCGASIIGSKLLAPHFNVLSITLFFVGKVFITVAFTSLYVYTSELWPTFMRHSMTGACSTIGRVGAIFATLAPLLSAYGDILPYLSFAVMAILAGILSLQLPETLHQKLPDTIFEAEHLGRSDANETS